jgi:hypothetical protein
MHRNAAAHPSTSLGVDELLFTLHLPSAVLNTSQVPYEQLRLLLEERSAEAEVLRTRLEQREASLEINRKHYELQVRCNLTLPSNFI